MISQAEIDNIKLLIDLQKLLADNIEAIGGIEDEGFRQGLYIIVYRIRRNLSARGNQIICDPPDRDRAAHYAGKVFCDGFQQRNIGNFTLSGFALLAGLSIFDILYNDGVIDAL